MDLFYQVTMCHGLEMAFPNLVFPLNDFKLEAAFSLLPPLPSLLQKKGEENWRLNR